MISAFKNPNHTQGGNQMKTCVIYARYSSNNQTEQSIEGQIRVCREYAQRNDIAVAGTYIDRATTGTNDNRENFRRMLKDSNKKSFDYKPPQSKYPPKIL